MVRLRSATSFAAVVALAALGACSSGTKLEAGDDTGASTTRPPAATARTLVARVDVSGGFVPMEYAVHSIPSFSLYGDGLALTPGAVMAIYPGPALTPLSGRRITDEGIEKVLERARKDGLDKPAPDYGSPPVADAPTTTVTVVIDGTTYVHRAEALAETAPSDGREPGGADGGMSPGQGSPGLTAEQEAARARLRDFVEAVGNLPALVGGAEAGEEETWEPGAYRLRADAATDVPADAKAQPAPTTSTSMASDRPTTSGDPNGSVSSPEQPQSGGSEPPPGEPKPKLWTWPVDEIELAKVGDCTAFHDELGRKVGEVFRQADDLTRFEQGTGRWHVLARPLLPDDPDCPTP